MTSFQEKSPQLPDSDLPTPSLLQWGSFVLLLGWLIVAPILVGSLMVFLPAWEVEQNQQLLAVLLLAILLLIPFTGFILLVYRQNQASLRPMALALLATTLYITGAALIRALSGSDENQEMGLRLLLLLFIALMVGGLALFWAGVPGPRLASTFGLERPSGVAFLLSLALIALATLAWPVTGALGDSYASQLILLKAVALSLPEMIFFWGAMLGMMLYSFRQRRALAGLVVIALYWAFTPSMLVPHNDWGKLVLLVSALPFAWLMAELRLLTGTVWAGLIFACAYRAAPLLFVDLRGELPVVTQPWQTLAHLWMVLATGILALGLSFSRYLLLPRWKLSWRTTTVTVFGLPLVLAGIWVGLWVSMGEPGFHNDGFLIIMTEQANLEEAEGITDPLARRTFVRERLIETAERSQAPVRQALAEAGLSYRPFYLINMIQVEGNHRRMEDFAGLPGVARVMVNPNVRPYPLNFKPPYGDAAQEGEGVPWNISQTQADEVWELGITGEGIVVAGQDTGYAWDHPALRRAYRGNQDGMVDHSYSWHDAWSEAISPFDDDRHGTHTMGSIVGDDGNGNQIGMAPGAQWIGCRNMRRGLGNPASYTDCMEFFLAPYPPGGDPFQDGQVTHAPHLINNSWGCPDEEGCDDQVLEPATAALHAAGIMMVVSAGNSGPRCQTVDEPPARYSNVFAVGATNRLGQITGFSSRGPLPGVPAEIKPDVAAPGDEVRSSLREGGYGTASGTSMAGPHVAGLVALLWSANPELIGQIEETEEIIRRSARPVEVNAACQVERPAPEEMSVLEEIEALGNPSTCACGGVVGIPNNVYGWGEIDALAAVKLALEHK